MSKPITVTMVKQNPRLIRAIEKDLSDGKKVYFTKRIARVISAVLNERGFHCSLGVCYEDGTKGKTYLRKHH